MSEVESSGSLAECVKYYSTESTHSVIYQHCKETTTPSKYRSFQSYRSGAVSGCPGGGGQKRKFIHIRKLDPELDKNVGKNSSTILILHL